MDDIEKRTKWMKEELRRKVEEHERSSRANQGKSQFPLSFKLKQALPLAALVVALYSWSFHYTRKKNTKRSDVTQPDRILTDVREVFAPEEKTCESAPRLPELVKDFDEDDSLVLDGIDTKKKW